MKDIICIFLFLGMISGLIASVLFIIVSPNDHWLWFSRLALSLVCAGFLGVILKMEEKEERDDV